MKLLIFLLLLATQFVLADVYPLKNLPISNKSCELIEYHSTKYAKIIPIGNISGNVEKNSQKFPMSIPVGQENINRNPKTGVSIYE